MHISADGKIVIAHDINTLRVFGEEHDITTTNYVGVLDQLLTLKEPRSKIPLFEEVLEWVIKMNNTNSSRVIKLMLDIKTDNDPKQLYDLMWVSFKKLNGVEYWRDKIIFGLWKSNFYFHDLLKDFEVINITFDFKAAQKFLTDIKMLNEEAKIDAVSIIHLVMYRGQDFSDLLKWASDSNIKLWFWTINDRAEFEYAIKKTRDSVGKLLLEGIITDDPLSIAEPHAKPIGIKYNIRWWIKKSLYDFFLFFFRRGYNLRPVFVFLVKMGFL